MAHSLEMDPRHNYRCTCGDTSCAGKVFQSVTTILGKAVPKDLAWHGQTRGVIGVKGLLALRKYDVRTMKAGELLAACKQEGILPPNATSTNPAARVKLSAVPRYDIARMPADAITAALKRERLTVNDHRDAAGVGGTAVHKALEEYIARGVIPSVSAVPENKRGSIRGLARFIMEYRPEFMASEVRVLSTKHCYAGTFDFLALIHGELYTVPKRGGGEYLKVRPSSTGTLRVLGDMKTAKWVYPTSNFAQLEAYEGARIEMGMSPTEARVVLWVSPQGHMEVVPSTATFADFLTLKASAEVVSRLDSAWQRPKGKR